MNRRAYPSDLTYSQWEHLEALLPPAPARGRRRTVELKEVVNGILYVLRGGIPWRMVPHDLPPGAQCGGTSESGGPMAHGRRVEEALRSQVREREGT